MATSKMCSWGLCHALRILFFFFNDTATTEIYTLSLHDALPISLAARAQAHVDLIEPTGGGVHGQQVHDALREPHEEQLVVDGARAAGLLMLAVRVVQEHEVQIRAVAELHAAELAVAHRADEHRARGLPV